MTQLDTARCGASCQLRGPRSEATPISPINATYRLPLDSNGISIVKKRKKKKKLNKGRRESLVRRIFVLENDPDRKQRLALLIFWRTAALRC